MQIDSKKIQDGALIIGVFLVLWVLASNVTSPSFGIKASVIDATKPSISLPDFSVSTTSLSEITASSYLLGAFDQREPKVAKILVRSNATSTELIASITKLMTATVALEHMQLSDTIVIESSDVRHDSPSGFYKEKDTLSLSEALHALLIESNNDIAWAIARTYGERDFINEMNAKASTLNLSNTHFVNAVGLDEITASSTGNTSDATDLFHLATYIYAVHPTILEITKNPTAKIRNADGKLSHIATSTNQFLLNDSGFLNPIVGGKTGQTPLAGKNLLLLYKNPSDSNVVFVSVVLHSKDAFTDTLTLSKSVTIVGSKVEIK